ncbi:MAG: hypothetical protein OEY99_08790 [Aigarchaeota archaeon]|nr:hypothetical protein [Aigarchaeota archaeon]
MPRLSVIMRIMEDTVKASARVNSDGFAGGEGANQALKKPAKAEFVHH